ncbi:hypothetical protein EK599_05505 [Vibrio sp. T187]|uniref:hypothetical protein n=1 Tax=Vibrio TaxID=662 RepID=UPI0010C96185|nr:MULTISPECIES: hypothetical protein [Vibrio]MBW3695138.1 hypothetical protein [Vibrio sp. T187]
MIRQFLIASASMLLSGCFAETETPFEVPTIVLFSGVYENTQNDSALIFQKGLVEYRTIEGSVTRSYRVEDDLINIELAASSRETRDDLVMRIQQDGEFLTCNMCPAYLMSNIWKKAPDQSAMN